MRDITTHHIKTDDPLRIVAIDDPGAGGANAVYLITGMDASKHPFESKFDEASFEAVGDTGFYTVAFQSGNPAEACNGVTIGTLLAICADRLGSFQAGPFACEENGAALAHIHSAMDRLKARTRERIARNVEGTLQA